MLNRILISILMISFAVAQPSFTERTIEGDFDFPTCVHAVDMDGDGDIDVLGAARTDDDIAWFENDGSQSFTERTIDGNFGEPNSLHPIDVDGDGDLDIIAISQRDRDVAWYENDGCLLYTSDAADE